MDHNRIEVEDIIGRYLSGKLPAPDQEAFEEHVLTCAECLQAAEVEEALREGVRLVSEEDPSLFEDSRAVSSTSLRLQLRWAAAGLLALALPLSWLFFQNRSLLNQVVSQELNAEELRTQLAAANTSREDLYNQIALLGQPQAGIPLHYLITPRSSNDLEIVLQSSPVGMLLVVDLLRPRFSGFRLELTSLEDTQIWISPPVQPSSDQTLQVRIPAGFLAAGSYQLRVLGEDGEELTLVQSYPFRLTE